MSSIAIAFRQEIVRLARKQVRDQIVTTRKMTAQHRRDIAALKRQVVQLERQVKALARKSGGASTSQAADNSQTKVRFVAKGLRSQRSRLALSASEFGKLVGVSAQSVYNWERGTTRPREQQIAKLASLRGLGKREVATLLAQRPAMKKRAAKR